jgi:hypothetical protein
VRGRYSVVGAIGPRHDALRCDDMLRRGDDRRAVREWHLGRVIPATDISDRLSHGRPAMSSLGAGWKDVDGRDKRGHDTWGRASIPSLPGRYFGTTC